MSQHASHDPSDGDETLGAARAEAPAAALDSWLYSTTALGPRRGPDVRSLSPSSPVLRDLRTFSDAAPRAELYTRADRLAAQGRPLPNNADGLQAVFAAVPPPKAVDPASLLPAWMLPADEQQSEQESTSALPGQGEATEAPKAPPRQSDAQRCREADLQLLRDEDRRWAEQVEMLQWVHRIGRTAPVHNPDVVRVEDLVAGAGDEPGTVTPKNMAPPTVQTTPKPEAAMSPFQRGDGTALSGASKSEPAWVQRIAVPRGCFTDGPKNPAADGGLAEVDPTPDTYVHSRYAPPRRSRLVKVSNTKPHVAPPTPEADPALASIALYGRIGVSSSAAAHRGGDNMFVYASTHRQVAEAERRLHPALDGRVDEGQLGSWLKTTTTTVPYRAVTHTRDTTTVPASSPMVRNAHDAPPTAMP